MQKKSGKGVRKFLGWVVAFVVLLIIVAGVVITHIEISSPKLNSMVTSKLSSTLGMPVKMDRLSVRLSSGVRIGNLHLGEAGSEVFSAKNIVFRCNLFRMLRRQFNVKSIVIDEPIFTLRKGQGAIPFPVGSTGQKTTESGSSLDFQVAEAQINEGKVNLEMTEAGSPLVIDEINIEVSSEGKGQPLNIKGGGKFTEALDFSLAGLYQPGQDVPINLNMTTDMDWEKVKQVFDKLNLKAVSELKGTGKSKFDVTLSGKPDNLNINLQSDLTGNQISYANLFEKPSGLYTKLEMQSTYTGDKLEFQNLKIGLAKSLISTNGSYEMKTKDLTMKLNSDAMDVADIAKCVVPMKDMDVQGKGKLNFELNKIGGETFETKGEVVLKDWKYDRYGGESLSCNIKNKGSELLVEDILVLIGEGQLKGSGSISPGGKYHFSITGQNVDMKKLMSIKKKDQVTLEMSGLAQLDAEVLNDGGGPEKLNGKGSVKIANGSISSFSWLEGLLGLISLPELMPLKYDSITSTFNIVKGQVNLTDTAIQGPDAVLNAEQGKIDLVGKTKNISADFAIAPHLVERERSKFLEFDKFFYVDGNGYAHLSVVWTGPLSKGTPDLTASLLKTTIKKYGTDLFKKIFRPDEKK